MVKWSWASTLGSARQVLWNLGLITLGSVLCAVAVNGILIPHQFFAAGFTGVALIIHYFVPSFCRWAFFILFSIYPSMPLFRLLIPNLDQIILIILKNLCLLFNHFLGLT